MKKKLQRKLNSPARFGSIGPLEELLALTDEDVRTGDDFLDSMEENSDGPDHYHLNAASAFNIEAMINDEIDNYRPLSRDLRIDDSKIPRAKNFYHFCTAENFLNSPPYLEQALIGVKFLGEYCPRCSDLDWMDDDGHEADEGLPEFENRVVMLEHDVCPCCGVGRAELFGKKEINFYNELAISAGQRSGKSAVTTMIAAYILHRFLMLGTKPHEMFGIRGNDILHGTFIALTLGQATQNLWDPFYGYVVDSPWFKMYHKFLRAQERKYGEQFLKIKDTFILYRHRNMMWYPATPDKRVLRGRTRIFAAIDELGWFDANRDSNKVKDNAHEVYKALSNSLATARQSEQRLVGLGLDFALTGYMVNVSSPSSIRDKISELVRLAEGSTKLLGLHKPTWKMNPNLPYDSPTIQEEFRKDPVGAARDFGAEPSLSSHPFISNIPMIQATLRESGKNYVRYRLSMTKIGRGKEGKRYRTAEILAVKSDGKPSVMALDAGMTNNSFALSIGSLVDDIPTIDCLVEIIPLPGIAVSFSAVYADVIVPLIEQRNVKILLADRWNSVQMLQTALTECESLEVSKQYSIKYSDMYNVKDAIDMGRFKIPNVEESDIKKLMEHDPDDYPKCFEHRPVEHLLIQMATIQDIAKKQVAKGDGFTDDLWRASALCHYGLTNPEFQEHLTKANEDAAKKPDFTAHALRKLSGVPGGINGGGVKIAATGPKTLGYKKSMK